MRDPSLHIKKSDLIDILNLIPYDSKMTGKKLGDIIFTEAQPFQLRSRYLDLLRVNKPTRGKLVRSMEADNDVPHKTVEKFNKLLLATRSKQGNSFTVIKPILKGDKQYTQLKEVAKLAFEFCGRFEIDNISDGMIEYIEIGLKLMRKYSLNRFKYYDPKIVEVFEAKIVVVSDEHKQGTMEIYEHWKAGLYEYAELIETIDIHSDWSKYAHFVFARVQADELKANYQDWIYAQYEGLAFLDVIPELTQFFGENAENRWRKYRNNNKAHEINNENEGGSITDNYKPWEEEN